LWDRISKGARMILPLVVLVTNMPVHHQVDLFDAISLTERVRLRVFYLRKMSAGRSWSVPIDMKHAHVFLPEIRLKNHWYINRQIMLLLREIERADLVVIGQYAAVTMQIAMYYCAIRKIPWVFWSETISGVDYDERPLVRNDGLRRFLRRLAIQPIMRWPRRCWGVGRKALASFSATLPHSRFDIYPYHSYLAPFLNLSPPTGRTCRFLYSGRAIYQKGFDIVVDAVRLLVRSGCPDFTVRVVGNGPLFDLITDDVRDRFELVGFVQHEDVHRHFAGCDVLLFPSRYDGWGLALIEGLASALPVIASPRAGAAQDAIDDGINGWMLLRLDPEALAEKMEFCLRSIDRVHAMSSSARRSSLAYDVVAGAGRFIDLVESAIPEVRVPKLSAGGGI